MYVFNYEVTRDQIQPPIGTQYREYAEFTRPMIFIQAGRVIYSENDPRDVEKLLAGSVDFDVNDAVSYRVYTPDTAVFTVERIHSGRDEAYVLKAAG
jgi:hypothetical protein